MNALFENVRNNILSSLEVTLSVMRRREETLKGYKTEETADGLRLVYEKVGMGEVVIDVKMKDDALLFSVDAKMPAGNASTAAFMPEWALSIPFGGKKPEKLLAFRHASPWWMMPSFPEDYTDFMPQTQNLLIKDGEKHLHFLPLCGENFRCEFEEGALRLTSDTAGLFRLKGPFLAVSVADTPYEAFEKSYRFAHDLGAIKVPLREERVCPEHFNNFGFCTWDAFYYEVTSEKIYKKLAEFKEKGIPVRWMIIDAGWMTVNGDKLAGFEEDRKKFPEGLKETIRRIKAEYGVEKVGVWHAFNGYWCGVDPESQLYKEQKENLMITPAGICVAALDEEKAFRFWDAWHHYLASSGVDFLKVDNQSSNSSYMIGMLPSVEGCRIYHRAVERSIWRNFNGAVIDCMGLDMENQFARPWSAVERNSDDFFPRRERGFISHLVQNVYNTLWHGQMYVCDFDMWWSDHESAVQSGALRSISGSPIYVSDEYGHSSAETILPIVDEDGSLMRPESPAMPMPDCIYVDCPKEDKLLSVFNKSGENFALASFNVSDKEIAGEVDLAAIPGLKKDEKYIAYEYFTKKWVDLAKESRIGLTLPKDGLAMFSIYPVKNDGEEYAMVGNTEKYLPIASKFLARKLLRELGL